MIHDLLTKFRKPSVLAGGFLFLLLISLSSCVSSTQLEQTQNSLEHQQSSYIPDSFEWQKIENIDFAEYFFFENKNYPVRYHCIKIDLSNQNLSIVTFPSSENDFTHKNGKATNYFPGIRAKQFSKKYDSMLTINTAPFGGKNGKWDSIAKVTSTRRICGIHVADKKLLSQPIENYSAVCFKKEENGYSGKIYRNQSNQDFCEYDFAFGGFFTILKDFQKLPFPLKTNDSRTALGFSEDEKTLYILAVEGERHRRSIGLSFQECADIMLAIGAKDAMQMDGGGSTSLFINQKNALSYPSIRKCAVFLGFKNK